MRGSALYFHQGGSFHHVVTFRQNNAGLHRGAARRTDAPCDFMSVRAVSAVWIFCWRPSVVRPPHVELFFIHTFSLRPPAYFPLLGRVGDDNVKPHGAAKSPPGANSFYGERVKSRYRTETQEETFIKAALLCRCLSGVCGYISIFKWGKKMYFCAKAEVPHTLLSLLFSCFCNFLPLIFASFPPHLQPRRSACKNRKNKKKATSRTSELQWNSRFKCIKCIICCLHKYTNSNYGFEDQQLLLCFMRCWNLSKKCGRI